MHQGSCHCGAVRMTLPSTPEVATDCNCSKCRRIGGPWVFFECGSVKIEADPDAIAEYIWGDRTLRTMFCRTCGCVTHWEPLQPMPGAKHGVNRGSSSTNEHVRRGAVPSAAERLRRADVLSQAAVGGGRR